MRKQNFNWIVNTITPILSKSMLFIQAQEPVLYLVCLQYSFTCLFVVISRTGTKCWQKHMNFYMHHLCIYCTVYIVHIYRFDGKSNFGRFCKRVNHLELSISRNEKIETPWILLKIFAKRFCLNTTSIYEQKKTNRINGENFSQNWRALWL